MKSDTAYEFFSQGKGQLHYHVIFEWVIRLINIIKLVNVHIFYKKYFWTHSKMDLNVSVIEKHNPKIWKHWRYTSSEKYSTSSKLFNSDSNKENKIKITQAAESLKRIQLKINKQTKSQQTILFWVHLMTIFSCKLDYIWNEL